MKYRTNVLAAVCLAFGLSSAPAVAQLNITVLCHGVEGLEPNPVFQSASYNFFRKLAAVPKMNHITAWIEGYLTGVSVKNVACAKRANDCLINTSAQQRVAMVEMTANAEPYKWGGRASTSIFIYNGFVAPCLKGEIPLR